MDSSQDLLALGLCNTVGAMFQCFAVSCSFSRSMVQDSIGVKTQMAGLVSALLILTILLKIGHLFEQLPKAMLAVIIVVNLSGILAQFKDVCVLWKSDRLDLLVWVFTLISTLVFNLDLGLAVAVVFSLLTLIYRTQHSSTLVLGGIPGTDCYRDVGLYAEAKQVPGVTILSHSSPIYFANSELVFTQIRQTVSRDQKENPAPSSAETTTHTHCLVLDLSSVTFMDSVAKTGLCKKQCYLSSRLRVVYGTACSAPVSSHRSIMLSSAASAPCPSLWRICYRQSLGEVAEASAGRQMDPMGKTQELSQACPVYNPESGA
ncbi:solute carrier family 26 member 6-like [Notothenia coriiceps]|uniref:Solute carrier family 26 member 6-like n=1 Tax=Notothenia coriiceps TaxID=8208 RepID=A0A6I9MDF0_9TELE|nr:PREDICTED: solute carrier family 26 member 6-like [Notothenia coriiceps]